MREGLFLKKNVEKWNSYQHTAPADPDETAERFITLLDDLSYARTFYPHSKVTHWINGITAGLYLRLYRKKREQFSRIFSFWRFELPLLFRKYHNVLLFALGVFVLFTAVGVIGAAREEGFIRSILTDEYVEMTERNIRNGDPFGVYRSDSSFAMFVRIALNNIFVAFLMAAGGLLAGIGTIYSMWNNGLMLGSFQYMFFSKGLGWQSILVIWTHGTLEILALVISATAGFIITKGILFPGTYSRLYSFRQHVKDALKLMIVLVPVFLAAAFLESYVTRLMSNTFDHQHNAGLPVWVGISILTGSLLFILWYFVILPIRLQKRYGLHSKT